jgi:phosphate transport system substrate-binding protein
VKIHLLLALLLASAAFAGCTSPNAPPPTGGDTDQPGTGGNTNSGGPSGATTAPPGSGSGSSPGSGGGDTNPAGGVVSTPVRSDVALNGAGATFPHPLLSKWSSVYNQQTGVQVNYQSIGSGGGIKAITDKTVDFAGSDAPLNAAQRTAAPGLVHIPETIGAVTVVYNVPGLTDLKLTGPVVAGIFLGTVKRWNDPAVAELNPGASLPDADIFTVHRSDGSGTTFVFTDYLSKVSDTWKNGPGKGTAVSWPAAAKQIGGKGNEGVAGVVQGNPNTFGYVELAYASLQHLNMATLQNKAGEWVVPSLQATARAVAGAAPTLPAGDASWEIVSFTDSAAAQAYPIASFTYMLVYKDLSGAYGDRLPLSRAQGLVAFLWWAIHDGQQYSSALQYPPLPDAVVKLNEQTLRSLTYNGQSLVA